VSGLGLCFGCCCQANLCRIELLTALSGPARRLPLQKPMLTERPSLRPRDLRVTAQFQITFQTVDALVVAYSANLSRGGLFLKTDRASPPGSVISLVVRLPDGGEEIEVPCSVIFTRDGRDGQTAGMGLKFIDPDETIQKRIEWFIINSSPDSSDLATQSQIRKLNLVIVDDDRFQRDVASSGFIQRGDRVRIAVDGLAGLALCLEEKPDVILTDVQMPRMDGWQMVRLIRARAALSKVPILFLTSLSSEQDRLVGYRLGVDDYLTKPHDPQDLVTRVDRAVLRAEQINRSTNEAERDALRGDLNQVSIQSVLGFLEMERRSGVLRIGPVINARLELRDGRIYRAALEGARTQPPREQLYRILDCTVGRFEFVQGQVNEPNESQMSTSTAILEHARRQDESE
jgi:uncharacterized protein (TIGR02266 family)